MAELPEHAAIEQIYRQAGRMAAGHGRRLSFHPDQFTLLSSPDPEVTARSMAELVYHAEVTEYIGVPLA